MTMSLQAQEKSEALKAAEEKAAIAKANKETLENELAISKAKMDIDKLSEPDKKLQAETDKAIADLAKATTDANNATILARRDLLKGPEITAPSGKITTSDGAFIESRVLANKTLMSCMKEFSTALNLKMPSAKGFVIYNAADFNGLERYATMQAQLKTLEEQFAGEERRATQQLANDLDVAIELPSSLADPLLIGYAAAGLLRTAADIASLLRSTTDYKNFELPLDENLTTASFAQQALLVKPAWEIYNPAVFPVYTITMPSATSSALGKSLSNLSQLEIRVDAHLKTISTRTTKWNAQLLTASAPNKSKISAYLKEIAKIAEDLSALKAVSEKLLTLLSTPDAATGNTPLSALLRAERLFIKLAAPDFYTLKFVVTSKGSNKVSENLWRGAKISFTAGTELSAVVYDSKGNIVYADSRYAYSDYKSADEIK